MISFVFGILKEPPLISFKSVVKMDFVKSIGGGNVNSNTLPLNSHCVELLLETQATRKNILTITKDFFILRFY
jgi:hypothetical protein